MSIGHISSSIKQINTLKKPAVISSITAKIDEIPNVAHFIWITGKQQKGGAIQKAISDASLKNIRHFQALNPGFKVKIWTDNPHLVQKSIYCADEAPLARIQVDNVFKPFSTQLEGFTQREKEVLKSAILRESHKPNRNIPSAKDTAQLAILRHEPGWYFDMDTEFFKPLPKTLAPEGVIYYKDNGMMAATEKGRPQFDKMLHILAGDYDIKNDICLTRDKLIELNTTLKKNNNSGPSFPSFATYINSEADKEKLPKDSALRSLSNIGFNDIKKEKRLQQPLEMMNTRLGKMLDKVYLMLDLKGTSFRKPLTINMAWLYKTTNHNKEDLVTFNNLVAKKVLSIPVTSADSYSKNHSAASWAKPITNRRCAEQPELPTSLGIMG